MKWFLALIPFVAAAPAFPNIELNGDAPPLGQVKIRGITYGGTGCPQGTVGTQISADQSTMTLIFDKYVAEIGPGIAQTSSRKNCQLNVELLYPGGFQYSVFSADYRGYASVEKGITGTLKSTYYFSGQTTQASHIPSPISSTESKFVGPWSGDYVKHDVADSTSTVWSPCGASGMLNINSQVVLQSSVKTAKGFLTTDSTDLKFTQVVFVQWQKCTVPK